MPLNKVRVWLALGGILLVLIYGLRFPTARRLVEEEINEKHLNFSPTQVDREVRYEQLRAAVAVAIGAGFIVLGIILKGFPVPITVFCLLLYLIFQAAMFILKPAGLTSGIVLKLLIALALIKAIHAAFIYQREMPDLN